MNNVTAINVYCAYCAQKTIIQLVFQPWFFLILTALKEW